MRCDTIIAAIKNSILLFIGLLYSTAGISQSINTVAGGGTSASDGVHATSAALNNPGGITFDKNGNVYIVEGSGNRVRKIDITGVITTVAGTGMSGYNGDGIPATSARLKNPFGIAVDTIGNIYIADCGNYRVRKIDALSGIISTVVGTGVSGYNGDGIPATNATITQPNDLCFDKFGNLYITDGANYRIRKIGSDGYISTFAGSGTIGSSGDGGMATSAQFELLYGIKADVHGNILVADWNAGRVRKITTDGKINTVAGTGSYPFNGDNIPANTANIVPTRLTLNRLGEIFITDYTNYRVRKIDNSGLIHTVAGNGLSGDSGDGDLATNAQLNGINGLTVDSCDNLYIAAHFKRIRKVTFNPDCKAVAVEDVEKTNGISLRLYPNPAHTQLNISTTEPITSLCITNVLGQVVAAPPGLPHGEVTVPVGHLPKGVYLVRVNGVYVQRFVKE